MSVAYLEKLNPEQRRAVEHGVRENHAAPGTPLLVIAGAGSGKPRPRARSSECTHIARATPRRLAFAATI
jgi:DNA helicase-2/ATP-dependent DNA helicase PcrA